MEYLIAHELCSDPEEAHQVDDRVMFGRSYTYEYVDEREVTKGYINIGLSVVALGLMIYLIKAICDRCKECCQARKEPKQVSKAKQKKTKTKPVMAEKRAIDVSRPNSRNPKSSFMQSETELSTIYGAPVHHRTDTTNAMLVSVEDDLSVSARSGLETPVGF